MRILYTHGLLHTYRSRLMTDDKIKWLERSFVSIATSGRWSLSHAQFDGGVVNGTCRARLLLPNSELLARGVQLHDARRTRFFDNKWRGRVRIHGWQRSVDWDQLSRQSDIHRVEPLWSSSTTTTRNATCRLRWMLVHGRRLPRRRRPRGQRVQRPLDLPGQPRRAVLALVQLAQRLSAHHLRVHCL